MNRDKDFENTMYEVNKCNALYTVVVSVVIGLVIFIGGTVIFKELKKGYTKTADKVIIDSESAFSNSQTMYVLN